MVVKKDYRIVTVELIDEEGLTVMLVTEVLPCVTD